MFQEIYGYIRDRKETNTYQIFKDSFDEITMKAKALNPDGLEITVHGTYALGPEIVWYDESEKEYIRSWEWVYTANLS